MHSTRFAERSGDAVARAIAPFSRPWAALVAPAVVLLVASSAPVAAQVVLEHEGAPRTFEVDTSAILVTHAFPGTEPVEDVFASLGESVDAGAWSMPGTARVELQGSGRSAFAVEDLVCAAASTGSFEFVAPFLVDESGATFVPARELLVAFEPDVGDVLARAILAPYGEVLEGDLAGMPDVYRVRSDFADGFAVLAAVQVLAEMDETRWADPDWILVARAGHVPNDALFPYQWSMRNAGQLGGPGGYDLDAVAAWDLTTGSPSVVVAILDDGIQQDHPDINQLPGVDFTGLGGGGGPVGPCDRHGTAVAGCVAASIDNGLGTVGVAPNARVVGLKVLVTGPTCNGSGSFQTSWILDALEWCATNGVRVTNTSLGFGAVQAISDKYTTTRDVDGIVHFGAAGNSGGAVSYPASLSCVNAVGAIDAYGNRASFSCHGPELAFCAPGQAVWSTDRTGLDGYASADYAALSGTSFASPFAAGVAALVLSADPSLTPSEVEGVLASTATDLGAAGKDDDFGHGLLRAGAAVASLGGGSGPPVIASVSPTNAVVLCPDDAGLVVVTGSGMTSVTGARLGGVTLDPSKVDVVDDTRVELHYTCLDRLGQIDVELLHTGGTESATIASVPPAVPTIELTDSLPNGIDRADGLEIRVAWQPGDLYWLLGSVFHQPTVVPGVVSLDIGNNDLAYLPILSVGTVDPVAGTTRVVVPIATLPLGLNVHLQAAMTSIAAPALPLISTEVQSGVLQF
ncbi:MAG: S8 family serine peptidase [Planctomycetota bacterium]